jgi:translation initiation factor 1
MLVARMAKRPKIQPDATPLTSNPFAVLASSIAEPGKLEEHATDAANEPNESIEAAAESLDEALSARLVVRRQKKGQGGKTVTCIEGWSAPNAGQFMARLKRELGCGARLQGEVLVVGTRDHDRVARWLRDVGAKNVVLGN